jgi:PAS domain S-box-containing protein
MTDLTGYASLTREQLIERLQSLEQAGIRTLRRFVENAPSAQAMLDRDLRYIAVSPQWLHDYGLQGQDIIGRHHYDVFPDIPEFWKTIHQRGLAGEATCAEEDCFNRENGETIWLRWEVRPWYQCGCTTPGGVVFFSENITSRKRAATALRESEDRYRMLVDQFPYGIFVADANGHYIDVNAAGAAILGYSQEEVLRMQITDIIPPGEAPRLPAEIARFADGSVVVSEWEFKRKDGSRFPGEVIGRQLPDGKLQAILCDISERKFSERALRQSEARLAAFAQATFEGIALSENGRILDCNQQLAEMLGFELPDGIRGRMISEFVAPEDRDQVKQNFHVNKQATTIHAMLRQDGSRISVEARGWPAPEPGSGQRFSVVRDITKYLHIQDELRQSELFYRQILESIPGMVFTTRPDGYCDYQSQQWREYTGIPLHEHLGDGWNTLLHPDDRPRAYTAWRTAVEGLAPYDLEYRVRRHDGAYEWFRVIGRAIRDSRGQIVRWFGVAMNIEQLKKTERSLAARHAEMEALIDTMPAMVFVKDAQLRYVHVNRAAAEALGMTPAQIKGKYNVDLLPKELSNAADASDLAVLQSGRAMHDIEQPWTDKYHNKRWASTAKTPVVDSTGQITGLVGVTIDITERKQAETERLQSMERQRDTLVREVHHRIKNHLQGVIGLLRNTLSGTPVLSSHMDTLVNQVKAIARVYGLQGSCTGGKARLSDMLENIAESDTGIITFIDLEPSFNIYLESEEAVPIALILNELVTNASKHQTPVSVPQPVHINLEFDASCQQVLVVLRSGPGRLPKHLDIARGRGLGTGLELVLALMPRHGATLTLEQDGEDVVARLALWPPIVSILAM